MNSHRRKQDQPGRTARLAFKLEAEVQTKLHLAHRSGRSDHSRVVSLDVRIGVRQVDVVRRIVGFPFELERFPFGNCEHLAKGEIQIIKSGPAE
jgi:hypothetical protein